MWWLIIWLNLLGTGGNLGSAEVKTDPENARGDTLHYFFAGHLYDHKSDGRRVDPRIEALDFTRYERVVLGGDVCSEATRDLSTVRYLDSIFDLGSPNTYYVLGNHDARNGNLLWLRRRTGRKSYFTHSRDGIVSVVLNTTLNPADCAALNDQYRMLANVCDTISQSSHLLIFHHHAIATRVPGLPDNWYYANWPYYHWDSNCFSPDPSYLGSLYTLFLDVQARGIQVINVSGDLGFHRKTMDKTSTDGIRYLACGIDNTRYTGQEQSYGKAGKDSVLIFHHLPQQRELNWEFVPLNELPTKAQ